MAVSEEPRHRRGGYDGANDARRYRDETEHPLHPYLAAALVVLMGSSAIVALQMFG